MTVIRHGLSIGFERINERTFMFMRASGKLTHEDYEIITPMIDSALKGVKQARVRVFIDATELEGWELRAAWDDFKLGLHHGNEFERIAILGNKRWQQVAAKVANWFVSGETRFFDDFDAAYEWIEEED